MFEPEAEHSAAREPTPEEWRVREVWLEHGCSVQRAAFQLGMETREVIRCLNACRWYLADAGWTAEYALAKRLGFGDSDARMRADIVAAYNSREAANG